MCCNRRESNELCVHLLEVHPDLNQVSTALTFHTFPRFDIEVLIMTTLQLEREAEEAHDVITTVEVTAGRVHPVWLPVT